MELGDYIRTLRNEKDLTTDDLAKMAGISRPYLSQIEKGSKGLPSEKILRKISDALNLPPHILLSLRDKHQLSDSYIEDVMNYESIYRMLEEFKEVQQQMMNQERELASKQKHQAEIRKIDDLMNIMEEVKKRLIQLEQKKHPPKYPLKIDNIVADLFEIGEQGQIYIQRQINLYKELFLK